MKKKADKRQDLRFLLFNQNTVAMATAITRSGTPTAIATILTFFLGDGGDEIILSPNL